MNTADKKSSIFIPTGLQEYKSVRALLASWMAFTPQVGVHGLLARYIFAASILIIPIVLLFWTNNALVIIIACIAFLGVSLWALWSLHQHKQLNAWAIGLAGFMIVGMIIVTAIRISILRPEKVRQTTQHSNGGKVSPSRHAASDCLM